jgi:outer membrane receptor for ferrienterochelin and colicin
MYPMSGFYNVRSGIILLLLFSASFIQAQDLDSLLNMSAFTEESDLQKILNKNLTVSSQKALSTRETPGIISLITAEEIQNAGARDLIDVLRLVPGFDVGQDLQFVMGIGLRGNWANEGKVLVLMDGQPFNELLYQTVAIGNRFPVDAIEQIEIIRGPGSAIYGGSAEYGVINIKTKGAESLNGVRVYGTGGLHADAVGRTNGGVSVAQKGNDFSWDASVFRGKGIVSDEKKYQDLYHESPSQNLASTTKADPFNLNFGVRYKGLSFRSMYDNYQTSDPFLYISYKNFYTDLKYEFKWKRLKVVPQLKYYSQIPWEWGERNTGEKYFHIKAIRKSGQIDLNYDITRKLNLNFGGLYFTDKAEDLLTGDSFGGEKSMRLQNFALYMQGLFKHRLFNATFGFRYEKNNRYGAAFVPRLALTKKIQNLHFKVLYSQAFRAPSIQNINIALGGKIKPEKSNVFEAEIGYQFTPEMLLTINGYSITTKNILTYGSQGTAGVDFVEWYANATKSGTRGFEAVYSIRRKKWYANLTYSFSQAIKVDSSLITYVVPQTSKQYVGFPARKVTLNTCFNLLPKFTFNPSFIFGGTRYAYTDFVVVKDSNGDDKNVTVSNKLNPYLLANIFFNYKDIVKGLTVGAGVYDIFNQRPSIPQAYNGGYGDGYGYAPIPGRSREYVLKLSYQLNFK